MEAELGILMTLVVTLGAFVMVIYIRKYQNTERMSMIDKGLSPDTFARERNSSGPLRWSLLLMGSGVGLILGYILEESFRMDGEVAYFAMLLICGGAGLGLAYLIEERKAR